MKNLVRNIAFLGFLCAVASSGYVHANYFSQYFVGENNVENTVRKSSEQYIPRREMTEVDLLLQLNKEEREVYRSLDPESKRQVLELASQSYRWTKGGADKNVSVELALRQQWLQKKKTDEQMLHNGMNRSTGHRSIK